MTTLNKPISRKAETIPAAYGIRSELIITLYPRGIIGLRESGRRATSEITFDGSELYLEGIRRKLAKAKAEKRKAKLARRNK